MLLSVGVEAGVVEVHVGGVMPEVIALEVVNLVSALIVVALTTRWTIVGISMVDHLDPLIKLFAKMLHHRQRVPTRL